jgi:hypothetical protein
MGSELDIFSICVGLRERHGRSRTGSAFGTDLPQPSQSAVAEKGRHDDFQPHLCAGFLHRLVSLDSTCPATYFPRAEVPAPVSRIFFRLIEHPSLDVSCVRAPQCRAARFPCPSDLLHSLPVDCGHCYPRFWLPLVSLDVPDLRKRDGPLWIPIIAGIVWASVIFFVIQRWVSSPGWSDIHRWALVFSATLVCMIAGFSGSSTWPRMDILSKATLNVFAVAGFIWLALKISRPQPVLLDK